MSTYLNPTQLNKNSYEDCPYFLIEYLHYSETIRGLSLRTINGYYIDLRTFFKFLVMHRQLIPETVDFAQVEIKNLTIDFAAQINKSEIYEFLYYATRDRANSATTRARKISSLKGLFKYLCNKTGQLQYNPMDDIEMPTQKKRLPKYLSLDESITLLNNIQSDFYERDYCIITLFLNCGLRISELVNINLIDIKEDTLRVIGKGNKERTVYLNSACLAAIQKVKDELSSMQNIKDTTALFISKRTCKRLSVRRVQQLMNDCFKTAGLDGKGYSPHKLRHTAATLMYQYGNVDMLTLKEILGHSDVSTTQIYTHLNSSQLKDAAAASPLANIKPSQVENEGKLVDNNVESVEKSENIEK